MVTDSLGEWHFTVTGMGILIPCPGMGIRMQVDGTGLPGNNFVSNG